MDEKYGVPRDIYAKVKIIGLFMIDIVFVGGSAVAALSVGTKFFPTSQWPQLLVFIILTPLMCLYLVLPTNGGKKNWQSMFLFFRRRRKRFISLNYQRGDKR
ncbi:DUF5592 family protein [Streptococcus mutans]|uniref:DUF5592 family protein n=1 Tax=Streptococcus mutans TaxID=1309 RepID=UPI000348AB3D|nr:DUF5592 family protein [Streptococcus mutans]MCB4950884.1 DUF5592 family protein [Streptococcus mutans]